MQTVLHIAAFRLFKGFALALFAALLLTWLRSSLLLNFILVLSAAAAFRYWQASLPQPPETSETRQNARRRRRRTTTPSSSTAHPITTTFNPPRAKHTHRWRDHVRSKVVEHAWETLCGSIVQEFIYDTWYQFLSPDKEFPAEIRRILNHVFGQGAARARSMDLRMIMEDASELLMEQLELFRDTKESILADKRSSPAAHRAFLSANVAARERVLRERMHADGNLHPALLHPDGNYKMLRAVAEGLVGLLADPADNSRAAMRAVSRELVAGCVLRPLMMWCTPYHVNKGLYRVLNRGQMTKRGLPPPGAVPALDAARAKAMQGHWEFEQRIVKTAEAESSLHRSQSRKPSSRVMPPPPPRLRQHRSRSHDELTLLTAAAAAAGDTAIGDAPPLSSSLLCTQSSPSGPPGAQPARFWSETQGVTSAAAAAAALHHSPRREEAAAAAPPPPSAEKEGATMVAPLSTNTTTASGVPAEVSLGSVTSNASTLSTTTTTCPGQHQHRHPLFLETFSPDSLNTTALLQPPSFDTLQNLETTSLHDSIPAISRGVSATAGGDGGGSINNNTAAEVCCESTTTTNTTNNTSGMMLRPSPFDDVSSASFSGGTTTTTAVGGTTVDATDARASRDPPLLSPHASTTTALPEGVFHAHHPSPAATLTGFAGLPRARVVAADLDTAGTKEFVIYKIRVGDDSGREWTVSRRYRHFETIHRQLRGTPTYRSKLPPKRIFIHTQNEDFVEDRRHALDTYLQEVLSSPVLARSGDVWEFLRIGSERFEELNGRKSSTTNDVLNEGGGSGAMFSNSGDAGPGAKLKRGISRSVLAASTSVKRGVREVAGGVTHGVSGVTNAAVDGVGAVLNEARAGLSSLRHHRRSSSVPEELQDFDILDAAAGGGGNGNGSLGGINASNSSSIYRSNSSRKVSGGGGGVIGNDPISKAGAGLLRTATASARKMRNVLKSQASLTHLYESDDGGGGGGGGSLNAGGDGGGSFGEARALHFGVNGSGGSNGVQGEEDALIRHESSRMYNNPNCTTRASSPTKQSRRPSTRAFSPVKQRRAETAAAEMKLGPPERSTAFVPGFQLPQMTAPAAAWNNFYADTALDLSGLNEPAGGGTSSVVEVDAFGASSPLSPAVDGGGFGGGGGGGPSPGFSRLGPGTASAVQTELNFSAAAASECYGISSPLFEVVDCVFQLQTRGFFRRQVYAVARQVLSLAMGDAIDVFLLAKLSLLRQESTIGRVIQIIQSALWPGGIWFQNTPQFKAAHPPLQQQQQQQQQQPHPSTTTTAQNSRSGGGGEGTSSAHARGPPASAPGIQADRYLEPPVPHPLDEEEVSEAVWELLMKKAPTALLRLVGRTPYAEGVQDLYEMIQSPTFMRQLGYGLLEIAALHLCPELKGLFQSLEHGEGLA